MSRLSLHLFQFCVSALWAEQLRRRCPSSRCLPGWGTRWGSPAAGGPTRWCSGAATCTTSPRPTRGASWSATPPKQMRVRTHLDISLSVCLHKILCLQNPQSNPWSNRKWANSHVSPWPLQGSTCATTTPRWWGRWSSWSPPRCRCGRQTPRRQTRIISGDLTRSQGQYFGEHVPECACVQGPGHLHGHLRVLPRDPRVGHRAAAGQAQGQQTQEAGTAVEGELRHGMDGWIGCG